MGVGDVKLLAYFFQAFRKLFCFMSLVLLLAAGAEHKAWAAPGIQVDAVRSSEFNSSFEYGTPTNPTGWSATSNFASQEAVRTTEKVHSGRYSLKMKLPSPGATLTRQSEKVPVTVGKIYTASAFAFLVNGNIQMRLIFYDENNQQIGPPRYSETLSDSTAHQWKQLVASGMAPETAKSAAIQFYSTSPKTPTATAYIDDVSLGQIVTNAGFENTLAGSWFVSSSTQIQVSSLQRDQGNKSLRIHDDSINNYFSVESAKVPISAGARVGVSTRIYWQSGEASPAVRLRFYKQDQQTLTGSLAENSLAASQQKGVWTTLSISATAPADAAFVSVYVLTGASQRTLCFLDEVNLYQPQEFKLGVQIRNAPVDVAAFGKDASGLHDLMFVGSSGWDSKFVVFDAKTGQRLESTELDNIEAVWDLAVATDHSVYIGSANRSKLFQYKPGTYTPGAMVNGSWVPGRLTGSRLQPIEYPTQSNMQITWGLSAGPNAKVYGGTSNATKAFSYSEKEGLEILNGEQSILTGKGAPLFIRSIAYGSDSEIYMGLGSPAKLIRFNPTTNQVMPILAEQMSGAASYVMSVDYLKSSATLARLFARLASDVLMVITMSPDGDVFEKSIKGVTSHGISKRDPTASRVYFTKGSHLFAYDYLMKEEFDLGSVGANAVGFTFLTDAGSVYLYAALASGKIARYKVGTQTAPVYATPLSFVVPASPTKIRSLAIGPNDKVYTSGFLREGLGIYDPIGGANEMHEGVGQAESMTFMGNDLYLGIYPSAKIKRYRIDKPWNDSENPIPGSPHALNPTTVFNDLSHDPYFQDRPFAMVATPDEGRLYVGTVPKGDKTEGAFAIYRLPTESTPGANLLIRPNFEPGQHFLVNQSIVSMIRWGDTIFGGASIFGGLSSEPTNTAGAELFGWSLTDRQRNAHFIPVAGAKIISDLMVGPNGRVWGLAEGRDAAGVPWAKLFSFSRSSPNSGSTVIHETVLGSLPGVNWIGGRMVRGHDGNAYAAIGGQLISIHLATQKSEILIPSGVTLLAIDSKGALYYVCYETELRKYEK